MTVQASAPRRSAAFLATLLLAYGALVVYASLAPFGPWLPWAEFDAAFLRAPLPRHLGSTVDLLLNVLAYLPVGMLGAAIAVRALPSGGAVALATLVGALLSLAMELLQVLLPPRIASNLDLLTNSLGACLGALPWLWPARLRRLLLPLERVRDRLLRPGAGAECGASLLLLWGACQLNPAIPFLGAGVLLDPDREPWYAASADPDLWALHACAAALNASGLGLLLACLLQPRVQPLLAGMLTLVTLLGIKATAAEFLLKPLVAGAWFDSATLAGLAAGCLALVALRSLRGAMRSRLAAACLLAGGLLAKLDSHYASWFVLRGLFGLNMVQLRNFAGLTEWINEIWPLLALLFLVVWRPPRPV
ncbi:MAG: VanZ family protein [Pseudomonadota bacterium]|nr:VanZ family protein [Pseudomonadota bacterium]